MITVELAWSLINNEQIITAKKGKKKIWQRHMPYKPLYVPLEALDCQTVQKGKGHQWDPRPYGDKVHQGNAVGGSTNLCWNCRRRLGLSMHLNWTRD
jgi:hypothetical protein